LQHSTAPSMGGNWPLGKACSLRRKNRNEVGT
jgi:hypothetical protein